MCALPWPLHGSGAGKMAAGLLEELAMKCGLGSCIFRLDCASLNQQSTDFVSIGIDCEAG